MKVLLTMLKGIHMMKLAIFLIYRLEPYVAVFHLGGKYFFGHLICKVVFDELSLYLVEK
ncbi:hypothetical protein M134_1920 [Bacteroides fragilis str. S24L34]|nr:hypothetical protein M134_1920 [Bacteroides fragilis str. S24L34]